jgi:periplasmic divalent cation tolerance protein
MPDATPDPGASPRVCLVTVPNLELGEDLARELVEARLAACVNVLPGLTSIYRWKGGVERDAECLLIVKTVAARVRELESWLDRHHPYDVPECVALEPVSVAAAYRAWLVRESAP